MAIVVGFKCLLMLADGFTGASLAAALHTASWLIATGITGYWRGDDCTSDAGFGYAPPFVVIASQHGAGRLGSGRFGRSESVWAAHRRHLY
ncbi:hypothetical protein KCP71_19235 [Salmonella enterica subsp. enterica]|nr:hypothetical protein KCP71_19235 [Salmonella enterica subsp. enterica]